MKASSLIWGLLFILFGVVLGLNSFGLTNIDIFFDGWWTLFIIIPSFVGIFNHEDKTGSFIWLLVGFCLLLMCNGYLSMAVFGKLLFPVVLVIIGLSLIFKGSIKTKIVKEIEKSDDATDTVCGVFKEEICKEKTAKNINLEAVFGSVKYDLSEAKPKKNMVIKASAIFGSVKIIVPEGVNVKFKTNGLFNDQINKAKDVDSKITIYVDSFALFGSVIADVK